MVVTLMLASAGDLYALSGLGEDWVCFLAMVKPTKLPSVSLGSQKSLVWGQHHGVCVLPSELPRPLGLPCLLAAWALACHKGCEQSPLCFFHGGSEELWLPSGRSHGGLRLLPALFQVGDLLV